MNIPEPYPTAEALMQEARAQTGLADFGTPTFLPGLKRLLQSLEEEADLPPEGRAAVLPVIVRRLVRRLEVEDWYAKHPETANQTIAGPISITGLPRTGTTALANMMSLDPQFRCLRMWEQLQPSPPPEAGAEMQDPRRVGFAQGLETLLRDRPEQQVMHLYEIDATIEDTELLGMEFAHQNVTMPVFGYTAWWRDCDMRATYAYQRRVATLLQSRRPPNLWLFKAPHHKFHLEAFVHVYPDARFVFTHRDPAKSVASYISFVTSLYPPGALARHDPKKIGRHIHEHLLDGMRRAVDARARLGNARFVDVYHHEMDADPVGTLRSVYKALGYGFRPDLAARTAEWSQANHSGAYGQHRYTPEQFGLSADGIRSDYDFYIRQFDVPVG